MYELEISFMVCIYYLLLLNPFKGQREAGVIVLQEIWLQLTSP